MILLLPSSDVDRTLEVLTSRIANDPEAPDGATVAAFLPILREHVESESNRSLATSVVITGTQPPDAILGKLDRIINSGDSPTRKG